jgi:hypothetical protein
MYYAWENKICTQFWRGRELQWKRWWPGLNLLRIKLSLLHICSQVVGFHNKAGNFLNSTETDFLEELLEKYITVEWLSILLYIQEVMGSDLSPDPDCFLWSCWAFQSKWIMLQIRAWLLSMTIFIYTLLPIHYSLFIVPFSILNRSSSVVL